MHLTHNDIFQIPMGQISLSGHEVDCLLANINSSAYLDLIKA
jgi:hypothetical protein